MLRRPSRPALAEVRLDGKDGNVIRWVIDAPRMGEEPEPEADLLIYPTREDAEQKTPAGKRYTWDLAVIAARPDELRNVVKLKKMPEMKGAYHSEAGFFILQGVFLMSTVKHDLTLPEILTVPDIALFADLPIGSLRTCPRKRFSGSNLGTQNPGPAGKFSLLVERAGKN